MSSEIETKIKVYDELKDFFNANLKNQEIIYNYPNEFMPIRAKLVNWIILICEKFHFTKETLCRTVSIFDKYISLCKLKRFDDVYQIKLIIIACLSISTKINEVNASYIKFFTKNILNNKKNIKKYRVSDVYMKEVNILSTINYCINSSNICQFNSIFTKICLSQIKSLKVKLLFLTANDKYLKQFIISDQSIFLSPVNGAILVFNATLNNFTEKEIDKSAIVSSIKNLNSIKKIQKENEKMEKF